MGFRVATGFHERPVYRDLFPRGLTALDTLCDLVPATDPIRIRWRGRVPALLEILVRSTIAAGAVRPPAPSGSLRELSRWILAISWPNYLAEAIGT